MFLAKDKHNQWVHAGSANQRFAPYTCPECLCEVYIKKGAYKTTHFAHFKKCSQQRFSEGETLEHLKGKQQLYDYLKKQQEEVILEPYLPELKQRPDLLWIKSGQKIALEFQCSPISSELLQKRTQGYDEHGIRVIWIVGKKHHVKKNALFFYCQTEPYYLHFNVDTKTLYCVTQAKVNRIDIYDILCEPTSQAYGLNATRLQRLSQNFLRKVYPLRLPIHSAPLCLYAYALRPFGLKNRLSECLILLYCLLSKGTLKEVAIRHIFEKWLTLHVVEFKEMPLVNHLQYVSFLVTLCLNTLQKERAVKYVAATDTWEILINND